MLRKLETTLLYLPIKITFKRRLERKLAACQRIEQDSYSPHITGRPVVILFSYNLRRHVAWSATKDSKFLPWLNTESKVNKLDLVLSIQKNIFQLDVSMRNLFWVNVSHRWTKLWENRPTLVLADLSVWSWLHELLETLTLNVLHDQVDLSRLVNCIIEQRNIWMI